MDWFRVDRNAVGRQWTAFKKMPDVGQVRLSGEPADVLVALRHSIGDGEGQRAIISEGWDATLLSSLRANDAMIAAIDVLRPAPTVIVFAISLVVALLKLVADCAAATLADVAAKRNERVQRWRALREQKRGEWEQLDAVKQAFSQINDKFAPGRLFVFFADCTYAAFCRKLGTSERPKLTLPDRSMPDYKDARAPLLYYIAGWTLSRLFTECRRKVIVDHGAFWSLWLTTNTITLEEATAQSLPASLVRLRQRPGPGGLFCPSPAVFGFFWQVERAYVALLTLENWTAYSHRLVADIHTVISENEQIVADFRGTITPDLMRVVVDAGSELEDSHVRSLFIFLMGRYYWMRGNDFTRKLQSNVQAVSAVERVNSLRAKIAAAAAAALSSKTNQAAGPGAPAPRTEPPALVIEEQSLSEEEVLAAFDELEHAAEEAECESDDECDPDPAANPPPPGDA